MSRYLGEQVTYQQLFYKIRKDFEIPWEKAQNVLKNCNGDYRRACDMLLELSKRPATTSLPLALSVNSSSFACSEKRYVLG